LNSTVRSYQLSTIHYPLLKHPPRRFTSVYDLGDPGGHRCFWFSFPGTSPVYGPLAIDSRIIRA